ncbi:MAG: AAA-like domain-containing protein [Trichodesmium sp. MO_231.B1]|nr:AAA-like domain-containing protein [Trichodesmium sp. MO_231.B1]
MTENFYYVGGTIPFDRQEVYVSRKADKDLLESLKSGQFSYVFNSRQMGKSSLMVNIKEKFKENKDIICIDYSLQNRPTDESNFYNTLIQNIGEKIDEKFIAVPQDREIGCNDLTEFFQKVLSSNKTIKIIVFIDEIDVLFDFYWRDNFFGLIRAYSEYKAHSDKQEYRRLTFCLLGVATPFDLIQDNAKSPFNIQCERIELEGFKSNECSNLEAGLKVVAANQKLLMEWIIDWTRGQPFLTQKICHLVVTSGLNFSTEEREKMKLDSLVEEKIIENGLSEEKDDPEHLRTIRKRLIEDKQVHFLLNLYQRILNEGSIESQDDYVYQKLRLSGLVVKREGRLEVFNEIYKRIFNQDWIEEELNNIIPIEYKEKKAAWEASASTTTHRDKSWLLYGYELKKAIDKKYSDFSGEDRIFIEKSKLDIEIISDYKINLELTDEQEDIIITTAIDWTNRQKKILEKLIYIINEQGKLIKDIPKDYNFKEWVNNLVEEQLLNDEEIKKEIEVKITQTSEEKRFWLLVTYGKILHPTYQVKDYEIPSDICTEADDLLKIGLVRKRYEYIQDEYTYWEVANEVYTKIFNQKYIENNLPAFRFNDELGLSYGKKFGLWLINQEDKHLLSNEEISAILPKLDNQELELSYEEHLFLIKSQIKVNLN